MFGALRKLFLGRIIRGMARFARNVGDPWSLDDVQQYVASEYQEDLGNCFGKNPSVIKRYEYAFGLSYALFHWEMYHSSNGNVYVYFPLTGERRIYRR